jgi:hypothetical protein
MRRERISQDAKGWFAGPWNSSLDISVGFANYRDQRPVGCTYSILLEIDRIRCAGRVWYSTG